jgi:8-oxo-dGTP pyrophosphatase MutT (NUDIX family)
MADAADGSVVETARRELAEELRIEIPEAELVERLMVLGVGYDLLRLNPRSACDSISRMASSPPPAGRRPWRVRRPGSDRHRR